MLRNQFLFIFSALLIRFSVFCQGPSNDIEENQKNLNQSNNPISKEETTDKTVKIDKKRQLYRVPQKKTKKHHKVLFYDLSLKGGLFNPTTSKDLIKDKYKKPNYNFILGANMLLPFGPFVFSLGPSINYMYNFSGATYEKESQTRFSYYALEAHLETGVKFSLRSFPYLQPLAFASVGYAFLEEDVGNKKTDKEKEDRYQKKQHKLPIFSLGFGVDVSLYSFIPESYVSATDRLFLNDVLLSFSYRKVIDNSKEELYSLSGNYYEIGLKFLFN